MSTILCATDFSPAADRALLVAKTLAVMEHASLEVLHVLHMPLWAPSEFLHKPTASSHSEGAEAQLEQRKRSLADHVSDVASSLRTGFIDEAIVQRAAELRAALVVVATHSRGGVERAFMGSIAERVIRTSQSPVLAVPPAGELRIAEWNAPDRPLRITAGIDLSRASDAALDWLKDLRRHVEYRLRLVHLYWPPREHERLGLDPPDPFEPDPEAINILTRELQTHVDAHLGETEVSLRLRPLWGGEDEVLLQEAETDEADLIVVGTRQGRGGSTAIATVRAARVPVVCVPAPAATVARVRAPKPLESVLVTTDLSPLGNGAIPQAYRLLMRGRGTVTLLHVADPEALWLSPDRRNEMETELLNLVPRGIDPHAIRTRTLVVDSESPGEAIVQAARRIGPDVVVMSSHGRSGLGRALRGSVTDQVLHAAPMPVLVVVDPERARS